MGVTFVEILDMRLSVSQYLQQKLSKPAPLNDLIFLIWLKMDCLIFVLITKYNLTITARFINPFQNLLSRPDEQSELAKQLATCHLHHQFPSFGGVSAGRGGKNVPNPKTRPIKPLPPYSKHYTSHCSKDTESHSPPGKIR